MKINKQIQYTALLSRVWQQTHATVLNHPDSSAKVNQDLKPQQKNCKSNRAKGKRKAETN